MIVTSRCEGPPSRICEDLSGPVALTNAEGWAGAIRSKCPEDVLGGLFKATAGEEATLHQQGDD